jgi:hypothetical protein
MITHRSEPNRFREGFEAVVLIGVASLFAPLTCAQDQDASTLPDGWKGQLIYETTSSSSMARANVVLTISGAIPFSMDGGHLSGQGTLSYLNDITAGDCDTKVTATIEVSLDGGYELEPVAGLLTVADDAGTPDAGSPRVKLKTQSTSKMSGFDGTVSCRGKTTKIPAMPQLSQAQTSQIKLPMKDGGQSTQQFNAGGVSIASRVTGQLDCQWDYDGGTPSALGQDFENDPRKGLLYPLTPNEDLDADKIKDMVIAGATNEKAKAVTLENKEVEGLTKYYLPNKDDVTVAVTSQSAKFSAEKLCAWDTSVHVTFSMMEVYVAKGLPYDSCVRRVVIAHEKKHEEADQKILVDYANDLEGEIKRLKQLVTPPLARLLAADEAAMKAFQQQENLKVAQALAKLKSKYDELFERSRSELDNPDGAEMQSVKRQIKNNCNPDTQ